MIKKTISKKNARSKTCLKSNRGASEIRNNTKRTNSSRAEFENSSTSIKRVYRSTKCSIRAYRRIYDQENIDMDRAIDGLSYHLKKAQAN